MRIGTTSIVGAAVVLAALVGFAAPANAAPGGCNSGQGCSYEDANYGKGHINFNYNVRHYKDVAWWVPTNHVITDNAASSAWNNGTSGQEVRLYDRDRYQGKPAVRLTKGSGMPNLGRAGFNDKLTSACFANYCK